MLEGTAATAVAAFLRQPWPWYVSGPLIGLTVPTLMLLGNKSLGISSNLRHLCAILLPDAAKPNLLRYHWRAEAWNLMFALGLVLGGLIGGVLLANPEPVALSAAALTSLHELGVRVEPGLLPAALGNLADLKILALLALSGLLIGFGTRYGGGCTSGHAITGLSALQFPSLVATLSFFAGGTLSANLLLPLFL